MKKRIASCLLIASLLLGLFPMTAFAWSSSAGEIFDDAGFLYHYSMVTDHTIAITDYQGHARDVVIPSQIDGFTVVGIDGFGANKYTRSITVPDTVKYVAGGAFSSDRWSGSAALEKVVLPEGLERIGGGLIANTNVSQINIPSTVVEFGDGIFLNSNYTSGDKTEDLDNITDTANGWGFAIQDGVLFGFAFLETGHDNYNVVIPDGVRCVDAECFRGQSKMTGITFPGSVVKIGSEAFSGCTGLKSVTIPDSVRQLGWGTFYGCSALTDLSLGTGLEEIPSKLFYGCGKLTKVVIPEGVTALGEHPFEGCTSLTSISFPSTLYRCADYDTTISEDCPYFQSLPKNGPLYFGGCFMGTLEDGQIGSSQNTTIKAGTKGLARYSLTGLQSVKLPEGLVYIGEEALEFGEFTSIQLPSTVKEIDDSAFAYCEKLTGVKLPGGIRRLGQSCFESCTSLASVTLPAGLEEIGDLCFSNCTALRSVSIPNGIVNLPYTFYGCTALTSVSLGTAANLNNTFYGCTGLKSVTLPDSVKFLNEAFHGCSCLTSITLPAKLLEIGYGSFAGCAALKSISIPDSVKYVTADAFEGSGWLAAQKGSVYAGRILISYQGTMPANTTLAVREGTVGIASFALCNQPNLKSVVLPDSLKYMDASAFSYCENLKSVEFGGTAYIGKEAFSYCTALEAVHFPATIRYIDSGAFEGCAALKAFSADEGLQHICENAFYGCEGISYAVIPASVSEMCRLCIGMDCPWFNVYEPLEGFTIYGTAGSEAERYANECGIPFVEGKPAAHTHQYTTAVVAATCVHEGYTLMVCACGDVQMTGITPKTAHNYSNGICIVCGVSNGEHGDDPHTHSYNTSVTKPTCTEGGYTTYTCTICGDSYVADYVDALGHDFVDGICSRCGAKDPNYKPIEPDKPCDGGASCPGKSFTDMPKPNNWAHAGIDFCVENGLFAGTSATTFSPDGNMTRAMLVTVLYRLEGQPAVTASNPFSDVANGQWFTNAIIWAADKGIVSGVGGGKFNPNGNITREQIATIMYRYAEYKSYDVSATADLKPFPDETDVSAWAYKALAWANAEGLVSGVGANGTNYLQPLGNATRAQVAAILMRYVKNISKT